MYTEGLSISFVRIVQSTTKLAQSCAIKQWIYLHNVSSEFLILLKYRSIRLITLAPPEPVEGRPACHSKLSERRMIRGGRASLCVFSSSQNRFSTASRRPSTGSGRAGFLLSVQVNAFLVGRIFPLTLSLVEGRPVRGGRAGKRISPFLFEGKYCVGWPTPTKAPWALGFGISAHGCALEPCFVLGNCATCSLRWVAVLPALDAMKILARPLPRSVFGKQNDVVFLRSA